MANKSQDAKRASRKPAGKTYGGKHEMTSYQKEREAYKRQPKHKHSLDAYQSTRGC